MPIEQTQVSALFLCGRVVVIDSDLRKSAFLCTAIRRLSKCIYYICNWCLDVTGFTLKRHRSWNKKRMIPALPAGILREF